MNDFLEDLARRLAAQSGGAEAAIDPDLARELLDLARVVAHSEERRFAPLGTYLAGYAAGAAGLDLPRSAELVRSVRQQLESETTPEPI